jgi:GrpB-like predicted nucleotidyltransferase (UPF0157 family)
MCALGPNRPRSSRRRASFAAFASGAAAALDYRLAMTAPIVIVPYDPSWPSKFEAERALLAEVIAPWLSGPIEHVGSTAVPGLAAKPVIDIMAAVAGLDTSRGAIARLESSLGYCHFAYKPEREHWFCKPSPAFRTHHLHLVPWSSPTWVETLAFRDALRGDPELAAAYAALKHELAELYRDDREAYTEAKSAFVEAALNRQP